ncbi:MAG: hypothetical protein ACFE96_17675, partial [Candidatus Hermodarchaeota archaeon]
MTLKIPNWLVHNKWAKKAGIDEFIANYVNRDLDYGTSWAYPDETSKNHYNTDDNKAIQQLHFFHKRDSANQSDNQNSYVKAFFLHHLLDFFMETRTDINNIDLVFEEF